jgi:hypothetical protein
VDPQTETGEFNEELAEAVHIAKNKPKIAELKRKVGQLTMEVHQLKKTQLVHPPEVAGQGRFLAREWNYLVIVFGEKSIRTGGAPSGMPEVCHPPMFRCVNSAARI